MHKKSCEQPVRYIWHRSIKTIIRKGWRDFRISICYLNGHESRLSVPLTLGFLVLKTVLKIGFSLPETWWICYLNGHESRSSIPLTLGFLVLRTVLKIGFSLPETWWMDRVKREMLQRGLRHKNIKDMRRVGSSCSYLNSEIKTAWNRKIRTSLPEQLVIVDRLNIFPRPLCTE